MNFYGVQILIILVIIKCVENSEIIINHGIDESFAEKFPWVVIISNASKIGEQRNLGYGSLLHPRLVMTAASIIKGQQPSALQVDADCYTTYPIYISCREIRNVTELSYVEDVNVYSSYLFLSDHNYGFLILNKPFDLNNKIAVINLAKPTDHFDANKCLLFAFSWIRSVTTFDHGLYLAPFKAKIQDNITDIQMNIEGELMDDDGKIYYVPHNWKADFTGSPLACALRNNPNHYVQVAVAQMTIRHYRTDDDLQSRKEFYRFMQKSANIFALSHEINTVINAFAGHIRSTNIQNIS